MPRCPIGVEERLRTPNVTAPGGFSIMIRFLLVSAAEI
jgi:hypothetical protein